jgi:D-alanyl-D-alanine carboxypeptidase/D-alanyl-D-alanine-endopeptidase (penicillin-binding protein 4)
MKKTVVLSENSTCLVSHLKKACCLSFAFLFLALNANGQRLTKRKIRQIFNNSEIVKDHFTGFALYDQEKNRMVYELNSDKYFIPASNTKLFTFYTALEMLGDSIPGLRYISKGDSLIFWGTGDPSLLHTTLKSTKVYNLLKNTNKKLFYCPNNYKGDVYGSGWAWSDYNEYYQVEITSLPIQNNVIQVFLDKTGKVQISPNYFKTHLLQDTSFRPGSFTVRRALAENKFSYPVMTVPANYKQEIPWKTSTDLTLALLQDTLKKAVAILNVPMPANASKVYSTPSDSVYKALMLPSDNFIAEQLLLVCSSTLGGTLNTWATIEHAKKNLLADLPDAPQWVDGSGLSRYNLFTPRSMVGLLQKIWQKVGNEQRLHNMLPAGGVNGTLRTAYKTDNGVPFVWAKTGSLSNNHNQTGFLVTRKGKRLIYSFMNNNFTRPTNEIRNEMVRIITEIHNRF